MWIKSIQSLLSNAVNPDSVEIVTRIDDDDPQAGKYMSSTTGTQMRVFIVGQCLGYSGVGVYYDECARVATGDVLLTWNDDMFSETPGWDVLYEKAMTGKVVVGTAQVSSPAEGRRNHYRFAGPAISRGLYEKLGSISFNGNGSFDRCYDALCRHAKCEVQIPVDVNHLHVTIPNPERDAFYGECVANWGTKSEQWERMGMEAAEKLR